MQRRITVDLHIIEHGVAYGDFKLVAAKRGVRLFKKVVCPGKPALFFYAPPLAVGFAHGAHKLAVASALCQFNIVDFTVAVKLEILKIFLDLFAAVSFGEDSCHLSGDAVCSAVFQYADALVALFNIITVQVFIYFDRVAYALAQMRAVQRLPFIGKLRAFLQKRQKAFGKRVYAAAGFCADNKHHRDLNHAEANTRQGFFGRNDLIKYR